MEPLHNGNHWDPTFYPLWRGVPNSGASGIFLVGVVLRNPAVEYNVAAFSEIELNYQEDIWLMLLSSSTI